ncbi:HPr serine kinase-like protein [Sphingomonas sp. PP-F2F-G114-C0414]|uniref:HPr kinase/phosphorylase n=1 Tax=Sphingomonas sp. PP-F2F-G114-C0414 TaxID=2135662 RepID=UPI000EF936D2|nr:hypothetical protein [Sphingomonas sp. PP-F2F-G114-C0414]RMB25720.1 HPr serine kinase-like protein [Sphingomonas sp. PP-F2F-G114-C0414]
MSDEYRASAFGLTWHSDIALDGFDQWPPTLDTPRPCVRVTRVAALADRGPGHALNRGQLYPDGIRLGWGDAVVFDMIDGARIDYLPGPGWRGSLPFTFYSTISAVTLAWRGTIPFHACMVEVDGCAVLIAGRSGAGKSSLTAALLRLGARLVADDLAVIGVADGRIEAMRGRPTMRQHRDTAARIDADLRVPVPDDPRGKWLVRPRARAADVALPLAGLLTLTDRPLALDARAKLAALAAHLFRPRWLAALPNQAVRRHDLLKIAAAIPIATLPAIATFDPHDQEDRAHRALAQIRTMIAARPARTSQ